MIINMIAQRVTDHYCRVRDLMMGFGQTVRAEPEMPDTKERQLRNNLIFEEWQELVGHSGMAYEVDLKQWILDSLSDCATDSEVAMVAKCLAATPVLLDLAQVDAKNITQKEVRLPNFLEMMDAHADLSVVNIGGLVAMGVPDIPLLEEIDMNNLQKVGNSTVREDGKRVKDPSHKPPVPARVLDAVTRRATGQSTSPIIQQQTECVLFDFGDISLSMTYQQISQAIRQSIHSAEPVTDVEEQGDDCYVVRFQDGLTRKLIAVMRDGKPCLDIVKDDDAAPTPAKE